MINPFKKQKISEKDSVFVKKDPKSPVSEAFRTLRTSISFASSDMRVILVTSSILGEGKSTVAANLAMVMAQAGNRVLLIDADFRRPTLHYRFGLNNEKGLVNILVKGKALEETVQPGFEGLHLLTSGPIPPNPSELFASDAASEFLSGTKEKYDVVIIDTPPVIAFTDAVILAAKADGVVMVVKANHTKVDLIKDAMDRLKKANANLLGIVLNDVKVKSQQYYSYYYGSSYYG